MAEDNGASPLPRRVPGASDSPRPPTRKEQPPLPESVRQRLLLAIAKEQERAARESASPPQKEEQQAASAGRPTAPDGTRPPKERTPSREEKAPPDRAAALGKAGSPHKADHPAPAAPAEQFVPLAREPPRANDRPTRQLETSWDAVPASPPVARADALTEPFPKVSAPVRWSPGAPASPGITEAVPWLERPAPAPDMPTAAVPDTPTAAVPATPTAAVPATPTAAVPATPTAAVPATPAVAVSAPNGRVVGQQAGRGKRRPGRRYRVAGVLFSAAAVITAGSLALTFHGHSAASGVRGGHRQRPASGNDQPTVRDQAAVWVAAQIGRTTIVSADPAMCRVLESHGFPARYLYELRPETTNPLRSAVIVATPAVRTQFGTVLNSVYAPAVLASFGSGRQRVDIREIAPRGAAVYRSALAADLAARKNTAAELLRSNRITVSPTARKQLAAGQVDSRLEIAMAAMAANRPIYIVAFNGFAPGADANMPLRFADLTQASPGQPAGSRSATPAFVRSMVALLRAQSGPYRPLRVETVRLAGGQTVLRVEFAAPSPLGLFAQP